MIFKKDTNNKWSRADKPLLAATDTIVEAYMNRGGKPTAQIKEGVKTSYSTTDLELWKQFLLDNQILLDESSTSELKAYRMILGEGTIWVEDRNPDTLVPIGKPHIDPDTFLKIMINYLFSKRELQEGYTDKRGIADFLAVSVPTVDRLLREGMPSKKVRNRRVFNIAAVDRWLPLHQVKSNGDCFCEAGAPSFASSIADVASSLIDENRAEVNIRREDVFEPRKVIKKGLKMKRSKFRNLIKAEVLRQVEAKKKMERRLKALNKLKPEKIKYRTKVLNKLARA